MRPLALGLHRFQLRGAHALHLVISQIWHKAIFGAVGRRSRIIRPLHLSNPQNIFIGAGVYIRPGARLETVERRFGVEYRPRVEIGDGTSIEQGFHLTCGERVIIGRKVAITEYVGVFDIWHPYEDVEVPIVDQKLRTAPVTIGDGSLIGFGAVIQPGVSVGRNCVIGAHAVVTRSIPDFSVAVGAPARVIRQYSHESGKWVSCGS